MSKQDSNVIKLNRSARLNSAIIIFGIILLYVVACIVKSFFKEPITTYKVSYSNINNNISCTGIALRNESEVTSSKSGYLIYFVRDGDKIKKGAPVCTVDETGNVIAAIKDAGDSDEGNTLFTSADYASIRNSIDTYKSSYSNETFSHVYNFKSEIESKVMELSSEVMMKEINSGGAEVSSSLENIKANDSGVVTYYIDGYEKKVPETLSEDDFNMNNYKKTSLKSGDILDSGSTVFKMVADENWHIVCQLSEEQLNLIKDETSVRFTINNSPNEMTVEYNLIPKENSTFLDIPLKKYMVDFIDERFLTIEIILDKYEGLKVPNSALIQKETYKIPKDYVIEEEGTSIKRVKLYRFDEEATNGDANTKEVELIVYKTGEDVYYVDEDAFVDTDILISTDGKTTSPVMSLERANLLGVYLANAGVADFTEVELVKTQDEFSILKDDGYLKEFDNVVLDASLVEENQTLY